MKTNSKIDKLKATRKEKILDKTKCCILNLMYYAWVRRKEGWNCVIVAFKRYSYATIRLMSDKSRQYRRRGRRRRKLIYRIYKYCAEGEEESRRREEDENWRMRRRGGGIQ